MEKIFLLLFPGHASMRLNFHVRDFIFNIFKIVELKFMKVDVLALPTRFFSICFFIPANG